MDLKVTTYSTQVSAAALRALSVLRPNMTFTFDETFYLRKYFKIMFAVFKQQKILQKRKNSFCNITAHRLFTDCGNTRRAECKGRQIWRGLDFFPLLPRLIYGCVICEPPNKISGAYKKVRLSCVYILKADDAMGCKDTNMFLFLSLGPSRQ